MSDPKSIPQEAESIGDEIVSGVKAFVQEVETDIVEDAEAAWGWLKAEFDKLEPEILADLKAAIQIALTEALSGGSAGSVVTDVLNILARDGMEVLNAVKTDVLVATVGLTTAKATS